jgi:FAD/FMN-containing dehydrogenase
MEGAKKFGMGRYLAWIVQGEPKDIVNLEKWALGKLYDIGVKPICYYSMPFDFGRCMFFRIFTYINPENKDLINKVQKTFKEMYDTAIQRYRASPFRYRLGANWLKNIGDYYNLLRKIKKTIDPKNILNPNLKLFGDDKNEIAT